MTQQYVGTKIITAWPEEKDGQPGYGVRYADGYTSWSPAAAFEDAYLALGEIEHLAPHQQRLIAERAEVAERVRKLSVFSSTPDYRALAAEDRALLAQQFLHMTQYLDAVTRRIAAFS